MALIGCATTTDVVPMGPDTYMISASAPGARKSGSVLKASLYKQADEWCRERGLVMVPVSEQSANSTGIGSGASAEVVFRAVKPGDPEIRRTNLKRSPDTVIEVR